jgi:hypothetical protein
VAVFFNTGSHFPSAPFPLLQAAITQFPEDEYCDDGFDDGATDIRNTGMQTWNEEQKDGLEGSSDGSGREVVMRIMSEMRERLEAELGKETFHRVHDLLVHMHTHSPNVSAKPQLQQMVGEDRLQLCVEIDQLIRYEELYRQREAN